MIEQPGSLKSLFLVSVLTALVVVVVIVPFAFVLFSRLGIMQQRPERSANLLLQEEEPETPMELLIELYQSGTITQKEFDDVKKDLELYVAGKKSKVEFETLKHNLEQYVEDERHHRL